jgi:hypothetical protein
VRGVGARQRPRGDNGAKPGYGAGTSRIRCIARTWLQQT